jgi:hypothetical protein
LNREIKLYDEETGNGPVVKKKGLGAMQKDTNYIG